jgi:multiple sugar transport system permease protein
MASSATVAGRAGLRSAVLYGLMAVALVRSRAVRLAAHLERVEACRPARQAAVLHPDVGLARPLRRTTFGANPDSAAEGFRAAMWNSLVVATSVTLVSLIVGVPAAYAFARLRFPGRGWLILAFMATYMLPPMTLVIPLYQIMSAFDLIDTTIALVIIYSSFVTPFVIWIMRGYFEAVSPELDDAARVDGCSRLGALVRVVLPVSVPGIVSTSLLAFLLCWDEFFYALIMTQTSAAKTVPVALNDFIGRHGIDFGLLAAGGVIAAIPPVLIAFIFQRYLIAGLTAGGVKDDRRDRRPPRDPPAERPGRDGARAGRRPGCGRGDVGGGRTASG